MIRFDQWWLPDGETHLQQWMTAVNQRRDGALTYQLQKYNFAVQFCKQRRAAVDVGAHVGLWSRWMAKDFERLHAFEPMQEHAECWQANVPPREGVSLTRVALGDATRIVGMEPGIASTGDARVVLAVGQARPVPMVTLDEFCLTDVDLLKLDCEGFELFVLQGAKDTLRRCRPVVIVEQKDGHASRYGVGDREACAWLSAMGATPMGATAGDYIFAFPEVH